MSNSNNTSAWKRFLKAMTKANDLDREDEILLDHDYDGIKELDNVLPPWWLYGFYITIIICVFYVGNIIFFGAYNQDKEFEEEMAKAEKEIAAYKEANPNLFKVVRLTDAKDIEAGKKIFNANCAACHAVDGGGGIGPNLTDNHWVLGGGFNNIYNTITNGGRPGKGMIAWKNSLDQEQRQQVASYVLTLKGTKPANPKEAEGDVWTGGDE
ncbi:cbb3-type cytochrome c oxidase N-terminal domain-containing protein [Aureivirga sp. CE67]|uniref:cbb3-type cytochrome c oxidase N-terminal domain-containing protein n=1 Tax=Aureivirga sp. CE67 TaxID=1788983 RepID=UPI0018CA903C|nr:cbb3-type cytochrome c oxidase N-terminal domain-containing protein [Aureivirga sp. CE67]